MTEQTKQTDTAQNTPDETGPKKDGDAQGGADAGGSGNILGGVQPSHDKDGETERRHD